MNVPNADFFLAGGDFHTASCKHVHGAKKYHPKFQEAGLYKECNYKWFQNVCICDFCKAESFTQHFEALSHRMMKMAG